MRALEATLALGLVPLVLAACGSSSSSTSGATPTSASASTESPTSSPSSSPAQIKTATVTVSGASKTVLADSQGMTLYYRTTDSSTKVTCTGTCAANWPPVLATSGTPTGSSSVTGTLTVFAGPNGNQVLYNGHPLYRWVHDTAPGQATGQGVGGFLVATPDLAASS
ncbi:MAG: hypothetical protein E6J14_07430 [Chloroflexi bacterium]|nr:MAG: hypothetical protein E6J14_07430 [Chloroflexota bacterium]